MNIERVPFIRRVTSIYSAMEVGLQRRIIRAACSLCCGVCVAGCLICRVDRSWLLAYATYCVQYVHGLLFGQHIQTLFYDLGRPVVRQTGGSTNGTSGHLEGELLASVSGGTAQARAGRAGWGLFGRYGLVMAVGRGVVRGHRKHWPSRR